MKTFLRATMCGVLFLVGIGTLMAQVDPTFQPGPGVVPALPAANGGFAWGDVNGDNILDVYIPSNNILLSNGTAITQSTMMANIASNVNTIGVALADFNGDGVLDALSNNGSGTAPLLFIDSAGAFKLATNTGDLATAGGGYSNFGGVTVADIDHSGYLSVAWGGADRDANQGGAGTKGGSGIWLLKGGPSGFTNIGRGSTPANRAIDTTLSYEDWDPEFLDADNDGYPDLLMTSFRNGISKVDGGTSGYRKGCVLWMNDKTGKFIIPTAATLGRPIYEIDSIVSGVNFTGTKVDTGIVVDDTVRHFGAIDNTYGDFNNDGNMDLIIVSNATDNIDGFGVAKNLVIIYGKGDGTFTFKWDGVHIVANGITQVAGIRGMDPGDFNNDGKLDFAAGAFGGGTFANFLFKNNGDGTFTDVTTTAAVASAGNRSIGFVDYNNDGFMDIFTFTSPTAQLQKNVGNTNKWIGIRPVGKGNNMSAIGAVFTLYAGGVKQTRVIKADAGSQGGQTSYANFGLGTTTAVDSVSVRWPDGVKQSWAGTAFTVNSYITVIEGTKVPTTPVVTRPSWTAGDTVLTANDTLKWTKATGGTGSISYTIQIGTNKTMTTIQQTSALIADTFKVVKVPLATKFYWNVRATNGYFNGTYSAVDSFQTNKTPATTVPGKLSPTTNQLHLPKQPTLVCSSTPEAYIYHFQLDTVNRFAARDTLTGAARFTGLLFNDSTTVTDTTKLMSALTPNRKYFWRVRGWNAAGASAYSSVDSFTIQYLPLATTLAYPAHNQADVRADTLVFRVQKVDADSFYVFQTWTYTSAGQVSRSDTTKKNPTLTLTGLFNRARYFWKVQVGNQAGWSAFTAVDSFTTVVELPNTPVALTPKNSTTEQRKTRFVWGKTTNAVWYHVQVATTNFASPSDIVENVTVQTDTTYTIKDTLQAATLYYWHVSGVNLNGEGAFSTSAHFTTGTIVGVDEQVNGIPQEFALLQNYPNPFNPSTTIGYEIPKTSVVKLYIYDVLGRVVANLVDGVQSANRYSIQWNPSRLSSGVYFCRIQAHSQDGSADFTSVKKLLYMK